MGMLTLPHQMVSLLISSRTTLLSIGLLPYLNPDEVDNAPVDVIVVSYTFGSVEPLHSGCKAYSYNSATVGLKTTLGFQTPKLFKCSRVSLLTLAKPLYGCKRVLYDFKN